MKLHLPLFLRKAILALMLAYGVPAVQAADLTLGADDSLTLDFADTSTIQNLNSGTLQLSGGTLLELLNCGSGDGKTYTLITDISKLMGEDGSLTLTSANNAISNYFDTTQPGTGFWADGTLVLTDDGTLQLVLHDQNVKEAVVISTRQTGGAEYQNYAGVSLENISAVDNGGAISGDEVTLSNNGSVIFEGNTASDAYTTSFSSGGASGGAICGGSNSTITLSDNGSVEFSRNTASSIGSVVCSYGGAIYGDSSSTITVSNNGSVTFSGNVASGSSVVRGGAIYTYGNLSIRNNDSVSFYQNAERIGSFYRLRSIHAVVVSLSASAGKSITFRDSICISSTFKLNEAYEGMPQQGDIIFTGATTVDDLLAVKGSAGSAEEILASRTSEVNTMTNLYGGRLRVEDGAIYQGQGITVHGGSEATVRVKDAELSHAGYTLEFNAGTALEVAGDSTIRGHVALLKGSEFKLEKGATLNLYDTGDAALTVGGRAWLEGASTLNADLTLSEGAVLDVVFLDAGAVAVNGVLTFGGQISLGENLLATLEEKLSREGRVTLFSGLEDVDWSAVTGECLTERIWVGQLISNVEDSQNYCLHYVAGTGILMIEVVPEPATVTLSLLALTALAARRRRK